MRARPIDKRERELERKGPVWRAPLVIGARPARGHPALPCHAAVHCRQPPPGRRGLARDLHAPGMARDMRPMHAPLRSAPLGVARVTR